MIKTEQFNDQIEDPEYRELQALEDMVDAFAKEMKCKLKKKLEEGYKGWDDPQKWAILRGNLIACVSQEDGQYVDIANLAAMLWNMEQS